MAKEEILKAGDKIFLLRYSKNSVKAEKLVTTRKPSKIACHPTLALEGQVKRTAERAPRPLLSLVPLLTLVPSSRNARIVFPENIMCMFSGIWFLFLMPYREFWGHKIYSGIVRGPAFFYYAFTI